MSWPALRGFGVRLYGAWGAGGSDLSGRVLDDPMGNLVHVAPELRLFRNAPKMGYRRRWGGNPIPINHP